MKLSNGNMILVVIALLAASVSASSQEIVDIYVRTLLRAQNITTSQINAIDASMKSLSDTLNAVVANVVNTDTGPPARNLRVGGDRKLNCNPCYGYPPEYKSCWINYAWQPRCRRALTVHEDLSDEAIADLSEDDRRRHLQIATLCHEAKTEISAAIAEAGSEGAMPLPVGSSLVEQCFYELA